MLKRRVCASAIATALVAISATSLTLTPTAKAVITDPFPNSKDFYGELEVDYIGNPDEYGDDYLYPRPGDICTLNSAWPLVNMPALEPNGHFGLVDSQIFYVIGKYPEGENIYTIYVPTKQKNLTGPLVVDFDNDPITTIIWSRGKGPITGDLTFDHQIDVFDLILLKKIVLRGYENRFEYVMCDINCDSEVNISDVVIMTKFILSGNMSLNDNTSDDQEDTTMENQTSES